MHAPKIISLLVFFISFAMCTSQQEGNHSKNEDIRKQYIIPDTLFDFFPKCKEKCKLGFLTTNAEEIESNIPLFLEDFNITYIAKGYSFVDTNYLGLLKKNYSKNSINKYRSEDNNYFIIGSEKYLLKKYNSNQLKLQYKIYEGLILLPNFGELLKYISITIDDSTLCQLPKGYEIYVIKSGNENLLKNGYAYNWSILPKRLKHGYTSGVAFNQTDPYIIYWVVVW